MPYVLSRFGFKELMDCRGRIRELYHDDPETLEIAAERAVDFLWRELVDEAGNPACALIRFFKTHRYHDLPADLQAIARASEPDADKLPDLRCLILLASRGERPEWNNRHTSRGHQAIPLPRVEIVERAPMIAQLIRQLGVEIADVVAPDSSLLLDHKDSPQNVFYVPHAAGSAHIVAQAEFVIPYKIESVLGFGGIFSSGDLFSVILFSKVPISADVADQFKVIGLNLKVAVLPFVRKSLF